MSDPKVFVCLQITGIVSLNRVSPDHFNLEYEAHNDVNVQGAVLGIRVEPEKKEQEIMLKAADVLIRSIAAISQEGQTVKDEIPTVLA
jgi:hypothetical protein